MAPVSSRPDDHRESERRTATVMFTDISGFTAMSEKMDPEEITALMNRCFTRLEEKIRMHGGTIDKYIGDCIMALFGVPAAIENAPHQAVSAAMAVRECLKEFNRERNLAIPLDVHIGINSGMVLAGAVGGAEKREYTVMGDTVNIASRLEDASGTGQILVGQETWRLTRDSFEYRELRPLSLKGKAEPVPAYELVAEKKSSRAGAREGKALAAGVAGRMIQSELVGREKEMNLLLLQVMKLINGSGGIVCITGEAGIGKSRLMAELKEREPLKQVTLLEGRAISMGRNLSFHPLIDLLKGWAGIEEDDSEAEIFEKFSKAVAGIHPEEAAEIIPFVGIMMGIKLTGQYAERVKGIEGEALEKLIFKNIRELLIKGAELGPLILYIEDVHWSDNSSIDLLSSLFRLAAHHRILFLLALRPGYEETGERILQNAREEHGKLTVEIDLEPLDGDESGRLIGNLLSIKGLPHSLREDIIIRSGGNPFFIEEVVRSLIDEGAVELKNGSFEVTEKIAGVHIPATINEVLMARIDRLDGETRELVKTASVIGRSFFYKILFQVAESIQDIDSRLDYLKEIQLIRDRRRMDELEYLFKHALAQETAYESLLIQKRKEIHLNVAQAIEGVFAERLHEFYGMLAYHYLQAEDFDRTEEYMIKAGEEAMKSSASSEALSFYTEALKLYLAKLGANADRKKKAMLEKSIAMAYYNKGYYLQAIEYLDRVCAFYGLSRMRNKMLLRIVIPMRLLQLMVTLYLPFLQTEKKFSSDDIEKISLTIKRAIALQNINPVSYFAEVLAITKMIIHPDLKKFSDTDIIFTTAPAVFYFIGFMYIGNKLVQHYARYLTYKINVYNSWGYQLCLAAQGFFSNLVAEKYDREALEEILKRGKIFEAFMCLYANGILLIEKGMHTDVVTLVDKLSEIAQTYDHEVVLAHKYDLNARLLFKRREIERAFEELEKSISLWNKLSSQPVEVHMCGYKAALQGITGDTKGAHDTIIYMNGLAKKLQFIPPKYISSYYLGQAMTSLVAVERSLTKDKGADKKEEANLMKNVKSLVKTAKSIAADRTEAYRYMGTSYWLTGRPKKALRWWKKSIDEGEQLDAKLELSRSYFEAGKRLTVSAGDDSHRRLRDRVKKHIGLTPEECLNKAEAMFREMDLQWDLEQLEKVRAQVKGYNA